MVLQLRQLAPDHGGVLGRAQAIEFASDPVQPGSLALGPGGEQARGLGLRLLSMLGVKGLTGNPRHSLALKVSSPLRHFAAFLLTSFRVLLSAPCNCSWAAKTMTTVWPSLSKMPLPSADSTKA